MNDDTPRAAGRSAVDEVADDVARALDAWYTRLGRQYGPLSRPQRRMLQLVAARERVRVGDLAERLGLTTAGATRMVDRLEELGYVARRREPGGDQREVHVAATAAGARTLAEAGTLYRARVAATLEALTPAEREQLAALLAHVAGETEGDV
jgi:DNA-binding MarR family transcriptional regulator